MNARAALRALTVCLLVALAGCPNTHDPAPPPGEMADTPCVVVAIPDGDGIRCSSGISVRLIGVDSPELNQAPFGELAARHLETLISVGDLVLLVADREPFDMYNRTLAYVYAAGSEHSINYHMAHDGYAIGLWYPPNTTKRAKIDAAVADAQSSGRGLWALDGFGCVPRAFRAGRC